MKIEYLEDLIDDWDSQPLDRKLDCILEIADANDRWSDHFVDRVERELSLTSEEAYWLTNLLHETHRALVEWAIGEMKSCYAATEDDER